jgi:hypothetical protein
MYSTFIFLLYLLPAHFSLILNSPSNLHNYKLTRVKENKKYYKTCNKLHLFLNYYGRESDGLLITTVLTSV